MAPTKQPSRSMTGTTATRKVPTRTFLEREISPPTVPVVPTIRAAGSPAPVQGPIVLKVGNLHKWYGTVHALDGVNLEVHKGEVVAFLGPNGAGKTTFTKCVLGFIRPTAGAIQLFGEDISGSSRAPLMRVGLVPDQYDFYGTLNARQHLRFYGALFGLKGAVLQQRIEEVLTTVGMLEFAPRRVREYSHGMKQRLCIAQALLNRPDFIIFDEPTNGLDPRGAFEVRELIKNLSQRGITIFLSSHILSEVEQVCTRVAIISRGRVLVQSTVPELRQRLAGATTRANITLEAPSAEYAERLLQRGDCVRAQLTGNVLQVELSAGHRVSDVVATLSGMGARIAGVQEETMGLEEMFLRLTQGEGGR